MRISDWSSDVCSSDLIARKMALSHDEGEDHATMYPPYFVQGAQHYAPRQALLDQCWAVGYRLMAALAPEGTPPRHFQVVVQRLKYQENAGDFDRLGALADRKSTRLNSSH